MFGVYASEAKSGRVGESRRTSLEIDFGRAFIAHERVTPNRGAWLENQAMRFIFKIR